MQTQNKNPIVLSVAEFWSRVFGVKCQMSNVKCSHRGFSIVEMIVSLGIFTIVLFIATSAFLTVVNADRKSRATRIAMDNLNLALEDMSRSIKTGKGYVCGGGYVLFDCAVSNNKESFSFTSQDGSSHITYKKGVGAACGNDYPPERGCILRDINSEVIPATSPEIDIKELKFIVSGSDTTDDIQPMVVVMIKGSLGDSTKETTFKIQTTITQRKMDN